MEENENLRSSSETASFWIIASSRERRRCFLGPGGIVTEVIEHHPVSRQLKHSAGNPREVTKNLKLRVALNFDDIDRLGLDGALAKLNAGASI